MTCARRILGAGPTASKLAVLVRLGWLPLDYALVNRALMWFIKIWQRLAGKTLHNLLHSMRASDSCWEKTTFFKPAFDMIQRLDPALLEMPPKIASIHLKRLLFREVNQIWGEYDESMTTHLVHPNWEPRRLAIICHSRNTAVRLHRLVLGRGNVGVWLNRCKRRNDSSCSKCGHDRETLAHVLECPGRTQAIKKLKDACEAANCEFTISKIFTDVRVRREVELFISRLQL